MTRDQARDHIKTLLPSYLEERGLPLRRPFLCLNPEHNDRHASMSFDQRNNRVHCFSCNASYDIFDLLSIDTGITDQRQLFDHAYQKYNIQIEQRSSAQADFADPLPQQTAQPTQTAQNADHTQYVQECAKRLRQTDYLSKRGISYETAEKYGVGYDPAFRTRVYDEKGNGAAATWEAILFPTGSSDALSYKARDTSPSAKGGSRYRVPTGGNNKLFNESIIKAGVPFIVVEGEIDALSIIEVGGCALGLGASTNWRRFADLCIEQKPSADIFIALDNDEAGQKAKAALLADLHEHGINAYPYDLPSQFHDANDALMADREGLARFVSQAVAPSVEEYKNTSAAGYLQAFLNGIADSANTPALPTGYPKLDAELDGGLYEGLYIIGAMSSLGKTTFLCQVADQIAAAGHDVLFASLEMSRYEIMAKSISRETLIECRKQKLDTRNAKTHRGITCGSRWEKYSKTEIDLIERAAENYGKYAGNLYILQGDGDYSAAKVRDAVAHHIKMTGRTPVVIVDYLQILKPEDMKASDKQNTDRAVLTLRLIARDFKTPVFAISSLNRQNYESKMNMAAFKESGAIEYSADVLFGLQFEGQEAKNFDVDAAKAKNPRELELLILKNRNGKTGGKIPFRFYPEFNYIMEA